MAAPLMAFARPQIEGRIDEFLDRPSDDLDHTLAVLAGVLLAFRSDDAIIVDFDELEVIAAGIVDPLLGPDFHNGNDRHGQELPLAEVIPLGRRTEDGY